jgi:uncharacterized protein (TIGR03437 family)
MAQDFLARGVPLHGIGMQMHLTNTNTDLSNIVPNIKRFTDLGLQVQFTELDVRLPVDSSGNATPAMLATEAQIYGSAVSICLQFPLCTAVQTWEFSDKHSWIPGTYPGFGAALEFDGNYQPKPAYTAMQSALAAAPVVNPAPGMTNAASYANAAVSPGEIVVFFGPTFGPASLAVAQADASGKLPVSVGGVRLLFDGVAAPLLYTSLGQVSAVVPFGVSGKTTTQVQYEYEGMVWSTFNVNVAPAAPSLFTADSSGKGSAAILDVAYKPVSATNPAHVGDVIQVYGTGAGVTTPASVDGQVALAGPFPSPVAQVTAKIGGVDCKVQYAGGAQYLVAGALQVNVQIATGVPTGEQPIVISVGGVPSQSGATVWIK